MVAKSGDPAARARAIVEAVSYYNDPAKLAEISRNIGEPMTGIGMTQLKDTERLAVRGW